MCTQLKIHNILNKVISLTVPEVRHSSVSFSMNLGCPLLRGSFVRRLRRCAATVFQYSVMGRSDVIKFCASFCLKKVGPYSVSLTAMLIFGRNPEKRQ